MALGNLSDLVIEVITGVLSMRVTQVGSGAFGHGGHDVTTAGTAEQLASQTCQQVTITAKNDNAGKIYVGDATVSSTSFGTFLRSGDSVTIPVVDSDMIYIDADNDGEGIRYYYT